MLAVVLGALIEELRIDLHEELHCVVDHAMYCPAQVSVRILTVDDKNHLFQ